MNRGKRITALLLALVLSIAMASVAYAHAVVVESAGGTLVKFYYSDGTPIKGAKVLVYDANGEAIGKGKVDKEGLFDYAEYLGTAASIYMNDGEGHAATYEIPAETEAADAPAEPTEEPKATDVPEATEEPKTTDAPEATEEPKATDAPVATEEPQATDAPEVTEKPQATGTPEATEEPSDDEEESSNSAGTIVTVVIVVAAVALIAMLMAKRGKKK